MQALRRGHAGARRTLRAAVTGTLVASVWMTVGTIAAGPADAQGTPSGSVSAFGDATPQGGPSASSLNAPVAGVASTPDGEGYWLVGADGGVFTYGDARFYGSESGLGVLTPFVGIAPTPDGAGYWIAGDFGNVYSFGDAPTEGFFGVTPEAPVVGIAADPAGTGYWLVAADGGVFSVGGAPFYGSMGGAPLDAPVVGMAPTPDGHGYWLVAADGGVFSFGDASYGGSMGGRPLNAPVVGIAADPAGTGYWLVAADGGVFGFGGAPFYGSEGGTPASGDIPVVGLAPVPDGHGYWLSTTDKVLPAPAAVPSVLDRCNLPTAGPSVEPRTIVLACGDGNASLTGLIWSSWTKTTAAAAGEYTHNTCTPDCANGTFVTVPATIRLGYPMETGAGPEFAMISYTYANSAAPSGSSTMAEVAPTSAG